MDNYIAALDSETEMFCTIYLFKDVQNTTEIRKKLTRGELHCSVVNAALIADPLQVVVAANKAALSARMKQLTTKNIYTEVLFNLSASKKITHALTEFGINENDRNMLVVLIHKEGEEKLISDTIMNSIDGQRILISRLSEFTDLDLLKKIYKIEEDELNVSTLISSIVSRISCKDFILLK